ncbi:hypothetical protein KI387_020871, partial [Taxus chinensis]
FYEELWFLCLYFCNDVAKHTSKMALVDMNMEWGEIRCTKSVSVSSLKQSAQTLTDTSEIAIHYKGPFEEDSTNLISPRIWIWIATIFLVRCSPYENTPIGKRDSDLLKHVPERMQTQVKFALFTVVGFLGPGGNCWPQMAGMVPVPDDERVKNSVGAEQWSRSVMEQDTNRLTLAYFAISGLDILNAHLLLCYFLLSVECTLKFEILLPDSFYQNRLSDSVCYQETR